MSAVGLSFPLIYQGEECKIKFVMSGYEPQTIEARIYNNSGVRLFYIPGDRCLAGKIKRAKLSEMTYEIQCIFVNSSKTVKLIGEPSTGELIFEAKR